MSPTLLPLKRLSSTSAMMSHYYSPNVSNKERDDERPAAMATPSSRSVESKKQQQSVSGSFDLTDASSTSSKMSVSAVSSGTTMGLLLLGPRPSTIISRVERALAPNSGVRDKCVKEADKMFAGENFRLFGAILRLEHQQEMGAGDKVLLQGIKTILNRYIRPGSELESGCISDGARNEFMLSFADLLQRDILVNRQNNRRLSALSFRSSPCVSSTINVRSLFGRIRNEVERDIIGNPDLRGIIDRMLLEELETSVHRASLSRDPTVS